MRRVWVSMVLAAVRCTAYPTFYQTLGGAEDGAHREQSPLDVS
jgi:hypothetical protein